MFLLIFGGHIGAPKLSTNMASPSTKVRKTFRQIERFSYDLEMKAREQNRNDERMEIERFDWFIERKDKRVWLFIG